MKFLLKSTLAIVALTGIGVTATTAVVLVSQNNAETSFKTQEEQNFDIDIYTSSFKLLTDGHEDGSYVIELFINVGYIGEASDKNAFEKDMLAMDVLFFDSNVDNNDITAGIAEEENDVLQSKSISKDVFNLYKTNKDFFPIDLITLSDRFDGLGEYKAVIKWQESGDAESYYSNIYNFSLPTSEVSLTNDIQVVYEGVYDSIIQIDLEMSKEDYISSGAKNVKELSNYIFESVNISYGDQTIDLFDTNLENNTLVSTEIMTTGTLVTWSYQINLRDIGTDEVSEKVPLNISYNYDSKNMSAGDGERSMTLDVNPVEKYKAPIITIEKSKTELDSFHEIAINFNISPDTTLPEPYNKFYYEDEKIVMNDSGLILPEELIYEQNINSVTATLNGESKEFTHYTNPAITFGSEDINTMETSFNNLSPETEYDFGLSFVMGEKPVIETINNEEEVFHTEDKYKGIDMKEYITIDYAQSDTLEANEHNAFIKIELPKEERPSTSFKEFESLTWKISDDKEVAILDGVISNDSSELDNKGITYTEAEGSNKEFYTIDAYKNSNSGKYLSADTQYKLDIDFVMSDISNPITFDEGIEFKTDKNIAPPFEDGDFEVTSNVVIDDYDTNTATITFGLSFPDGNGANVKHSNNFSKVEILDGEVVLKTAIYPYETNGDIEIIVEDMKVNTEYKNLKFKIFLNDDTSIPEAGLIEEVDKDQNSFTLPIKTIKTDELDKPSMNVADEIRLTYTRDGNDFKQGVPQDMYNIKFSYDLTSVNNIKKMNLIFHKDEESIESSFTYELSIPKGDNIDQSNDQLINIQIPSSELDFDSEYEILLDIESVVGAPNVENIHLGKITTPDQYGFINNVPKIEYINSSTNGIKITYKLNEIKDDKKVRILYTWNDEDGPHTLETNNTPEDESTEITQIITVENGKTITDIKIEIFGIESYLPNGGEILYDTYYQVM